MSMVGSYYFPESTFSHQVSSRCHELSWTNIGSLATSAKCQLILSTISVHRLDAIIAAQRECRVLSQLPTDWGYFWEITMSSLLDKAAPEIQQHIQVGCSKPKQWKLQNGFPRYGNPFAWNILKVKLASIRRKVYAKLQKYFSLCITYLCDKNNGHLCAVPIQLSNLSNR